MTTEHISDGKTYAYDLIFEYRQQEGEEYTRDSGWYFWTETWADAEGPYNTRDEVEKALREYVSRL